MEIGGGEDIVEGLLEAGGIYGGFIHDGVGKGAVHGVDGDVVVGVKGFRGRDLGGVEGVGNEFCEVVNEGLDDGGLRAADVEQDGERDGVVAFDAHFCGVEDGAAIEGDVEFFAGDGRKLLEVFAEDDGGELHEVGVDVEGVGA